MSGHGKTRARRAAEEAVIPVDRILNNEKHRGLATKSDRKPACLLREGHKVHFIVTSQSQNEEPVVRELHCASHYCDYHKPPASVNDTVSVNTERSTLRQGEEYSDAKQIYAGEGRLIANYDTDEPTLKLTEVTIEAYTEQFSLPSAD